MGIYVWGTGCGASELEEKGMVMDRVTAFLDSEPMGKQFLGRPVFRPDQVRIAPNDLVIVTARQSDTIAARCLELGIPESNVLYLKNHCTLLDRNSRCTMARSILGEELMAALLPKQQIISTASGLRNSTLDPSNDYVRVATLELLSRQIQDIPGSLAELGVYRGGFARYMNALMPRRTLYLFDTFGGFDREEGEREKEQGTCTDAFLEAHRNTNAAKVLSSMPHPGSVKMKPGYFPESLQGLEDRFALVSLDADFMESTLEGLRYFWPRLSPGGYLMLHDWGDPRLRGVAEALDRYQEEIGQNLPCVPIPDIGNSMIVHKCDM